jgi:hypothetical protein
MASFAVAHPARQARLVLLATCEHCGPAAARLVLASRRFANLAVDLLSTSPDDLTDVICHNSRCRSLQSFMCATAVRLTPRSYVDLFAAAYPCDQLLRDMIFRAASYCRRRRLWSTELMWQLVDKHVPVIDQTADEEEVFDSIALAAYDTSSALDFTQYGVSISAIIRKIIERDDCLEEPRRLGWFLLNVFGRFLDGVEFCEERAFALGAAAAELELSQASLRGLLEQCEECFDVSIQWLKPETSSAV